VGQHDRTLKTGYKMFYLSSLLKREKGIVLVTLSLTFGLSLWILFHFFTRCASFSRSVDLFRIATIEPWGATRTTWFQDKCYCTISGCSIFMCTLKFSLKINSYTYFYIYLLLFTFYSNIFNIYIFQFFYSLLLCF